MCKKLTFKKRSIIRVTSYFQKISYQERIHETIKQTPSTKYSPPSYTILYTRDVKAWDSARNQKGQTTNVCP